MNESIDLTKILKDCPEGEKFWSKVHGEVTFCSISTEELKASYPIETKDCYSWIRDFTKGGKISEQHQGECILVPSKDQQDWSKFTAPWYKKEKFDPKTLQPFDKVLVFDSDRPWTPLLFSYLEYSLNYPRMQCFDFAARKVIPYNKETEHLLGTHNEAPEYYRYWED